MIKKSKLKLCNWLLLLFTAAILASGIQLEASNSSGIISVGIHVALGVIFEAFVLWHIWLHFGSRNWFVAFSRLKKPVTRILWWLFILTVVSALIALFHWGGTLSHSPIGGIHGKIGFIMILVAIGHICKRIRFFGR
ncbi:MAG: hypothetical protein K2J70_02880 [Muribaculaceae bacterium]|nr:hypothetical protein [Muribaculaceae bacterium]